MPIHSCSVNGKSGKKWGDHGHCYTGSGAAAKAGKQAEAAYAHGYTGEAEEEEDSRVAALMELLDEVMGHGCAG